MKKNLLLSFAFLFTFTLLNAQNTWVQKANVGGGTRLGAVGFSIGTKGYIGTGQNGSGNLSDLWEYDPSLNSWTQKASMNIARRAAMSFVVNGKAYVAMGFGSSQLSDFWEYDPSTNNWTAKANFPGAARYAAAGFAIGNKGYIGLGCPAGGNGPYSTDFWEYDPSTNSWAVKASPPMVSRYGLVGFSIGTNGYMGMGYDGGTTTYYHDLWQYNQATNSWAVKATLPGLAGGHYPVAFEMGGKGYVGTGNTNQVGQNQFWEYDATLNSWTQRANYGGPGIVVGAGFSIGNKGYIGTGFDFSVYNNQFWEYTPFPSVLSSIISGSTNVSCFNSCNGTATVTANSGQTPYTYLWNNGQTNATATGLCAGSYTVVVTDALSATTYSTITISQPSQLNANASATNSSFCAGGCTNLNVTVSGGTPSYSYLWQPGNLSGPSPNVCPTTTTTYTCNITDANGCTQSANTTVTVNPLPTITTGGTTAVCMGSSVTLNANGAATYIWNPGNMSGSSITVSPTVTTTYTITGTNSFGCTSSTTVSVIVNNLPVVNYLQFPTSVCVNWLTFGLSTATPSGGTYSGTGVTGTNFDPLTAGVGSHIVTYSFTDINGCSNTAVQTITVNACAGINDQPSVDFDATIFPNPFNDNLHLTLINITGDAQVTLFNLLGEPMKNIMVQHSSCEINANDLSAGVYLLQIKTEKGMITKKLIKE